MTAQVCVPPAVSDATPAGRSGTFLGQFCLIDGAIPTWPLVFQPQHRTPPELSNAQVWLPPAATADTPLVVP
jgi:hypothetical protein